MTSATPASPASPASPRKPTARQLRLRQLRQAHDAWTDRHADDADTRFRPQDHPRPGSDYNLHNVTVDASGAAQDEWAATAASILGLEPDPNPA